MLIEVITIPMRRHLSLEWKSVFAKVFARVKVKLPLSGKHFHFE